MITRQTITTILIHILHKRDRTAWKVSYAKTLTKWMIITFFFLNISKAFSLKNDYFHIHNEHKEA